MDRQETCFVPGLLKVVVNVLLFCGKKSRYGMQKESANSGSFTIQCNDVSSGCRDDLIFPDSRHPQFVGGLLGEVEI